MSDIRPETGRAVERPISTAPAGDDGPTDLFPADRTREAIPSVLDRASLLVEIAVTAAGEADVDRILDETLGRLGRIVPFTGGSIALVDGDDLVVRAAAGPFAGGVIGQRLPRGGARSWRVVESREPFLSDDLRAAGLTIKGGGPQMEVRSWLAVPLVRRGEGIGLLEVDSTRPGAFNKADVDLLRQVALALSGPIELADRYEAEVRGLAESRLAQARLTILAEAGEVLGAATDEATVLRTVTGLAVPALADWAAAHVVRGHSHLQRVATAGNPELEATQARERLLPEGDAPPSGDEAGALDLGRVVQSGLPELAADFRDGESGMAVPLVIGGRGLGAIAFVRGPGRDPFDHDDLALAAEIGRRAAAAVDNARLYAMLESRERQQATVATLGQTALEGGDLHALYAQAVSLVSRTLADEPAAILEVRPGGQLAVVATEAWHPGLVETLAAADGDLPTQALAALIGDKAVVVDDLAAEARFADTRALAEAGLVTAVAIPIRGTDRPTAVLTYHSRSKGFGRDDLNFLYAVANVLGTAVDRRRQERADEQANILRDAFIGVISHELRTPITTIFGTAKLLRRSASRMSSEAVADRIVDIEAEAERLHRLTEDLLVLSRAERGRVEIGDEPVRLGHLLRRTLAAEKQRWPDHRFEIELEAELPSVRGEDTYVEQVVRNLVSNAAKYSPHGSVVHVAASVAANVAGSIARSEVEIRVLDRGTGFSEDEAEHLFELFYRAPGTASKAVGAGIGLFVCRHLVEAMGGLISARPRPGGGAEFLFTLPVYDADDEPTAGASDDTPSMVLAADEGQQPTGG